MKAVFSRLRVFFHLKDFHNWGPMAVAFTRHGKNLSCVVLMGHGVSFILDVLFFQAALEAECIICVICFVKLSLEILL